MRKDNSIGAQYFRFYSNELKNYSSMGPLTRQDVYQTCLEKFGFYWEIPSETLVLNVNSNEVQVYITQSGQINCQKRVYIEGTSSYTGQKAPLTKKRRQLFAHMLFYSRKNRYSHPNGNRDNGGRWYPTEEEKQSCCKSIREPSIRYPFSLLNHCRTASHIANLCDVEQKIVRFGKIQKQFRITNEHKRLIANWQQEAEAQLFNSDEIIQ